MRPFSSIPTIDIEVAIVGGGIQGLWLLADLLDNGYQAVLLERKRPGFGQTGHSHVFLHEGHMFASALREPPQDVIRRIESVQQAHRLWAHALQQGRLARLPQLKSDFYIGWTTPNKAEIFQEFCRRTNLSCQVAQPPAELGELPGIERFFKSTGICLESKSLLDQLLEYKDVRERVGYCRDLNVKTYESGKFYLLAAGDGDNQLLIRAGALVLSAGAGNERLVNRLFTNEIIPPDLNALKQQTVKTFMLVLQHPKGTVPPLTGMFPDSGGIFIASRQDEKGRTVWLIGDRQRELVTSAGEMTAFDAATWFSKVRIEFDKLFPKISNDASRYKWGIYEATKAEPWTGSSRFGEGGAFPSGYRVHKHSNVPMWLTWPTLLTFAPRVANLITDELLNSNAPGVLFADRQLWNEFCTNVTAGECRWKTTALLSWADFRRCFAAA